MRKYILIYLMLILPILATAQIKVLESSSKKAPAWIASSGSDYFVASAVGSSLDEAKNLCLQDVKKQIISAVAENLKSSTSQTTSQTTTQNDIIDFFESFDSNFETRSAILPFINGISMSKVDAYYYEKTLNKATGITSYSYSIHYPFSSSELYTLIKKFLAQDAEMETILNNQIDKISNITSTEDIDRGITALTPLLEYFFDDIRISKTKQTIEQYKKLYSYISIELVNSTPGEMTYLLSIEGKPITTAIKPTFKSNCAMGLMYSNIEEGMVKVTYDSEGCSSEDTNFIEINYRIPYFPIKKQLFPAMTKSPLQIAPKGSMNITKIFNEKEERVAKNEISKTNSNEEENKIIEEKSTKVDGLNIEFLLDNRSNMPARITSLTLKLEEFNSSINLPRLDIQIPQGVAIVTIPYNKSIILKEIKNSQNFSSLSFTKGNITVVNPVNNEVQTVPIIVKYTIE